MEKFTQEYPEAALGLNKLHRAIIQREIDDGKRAARRSKHGTPEQRAAKARSSSAEISDSDDSDGAVQ